MTPGARVQAAIGCLDAIIAGMPSEQALIRWARGARYAGSADRRAVRDHVHDALRRRRSAARVGGGDTGRALMIGALVLDGTDPGALFTGEGHAPAPLQAGEGQGRLDGAPEAVRADLPDWVWSRLVAQHGADAAARIGAAQRGRAPLWLRVNLAQASREAAAQALATEDIATRPHHEVATALEVTARAQKLRQTRAWADGMVELQDAAPQAAVLRLPLVPGMRILDHCAGGGGKALAVAALTGGPVFAHDADPARMGDIPARAARARADIRILPAPAREAPFDMVIVDAPCSGSGTWRRTPDAKWRLTPERLEELVALQARIMAEAAALVAPGGVLAWMTCSVLDKENNARVAALAAEGGWRVADSHLWLPGLHGDGFYLAVMKKT
ncbi:MAG: RsmB/NOP family class I SAM-dependent RNA methyltransferase [Rubellimicrobium sp.]|nr:RsmB/NOP family class I SAM-dependent RNA methyltransferase [Rubellimicrobium sp.]